MSDIQPVALRAFFAVLVSFWSPETHAQQPSFSKDGSSTGTSRPRSELRDVELGPGQTLKLQVIDTEGQGLPEAIVKTVSKDSVHNIVTDKTGNAEIELVRGGVIHFQIGQSEYACRTWLKGTAPPNAIPSIGLVDESAPIVRTKGSTNDACPPHRRLPRLERSCYGLTILALGGTAAYMALSRDNDPASP